ncbi:hypothetical protein CK510_19870, partial [Brunnivagina elsteri CCALA 953]
MLFGHSVACYLQKPLGHLPAGGTYALLYEKAYHSVEASYAQRVARFATQRLPRCRRLESRGDATLPSPKRAATPTERETRNANGKSFAYVPQHDNTGSFILWL